MEIAYKGARKKIAAFNGVPVMIREIYQNYHLPMAPYNMTLNEIHFWYDPLIEELCKMQKPKRGK